MKAGFIRVPRNFLYSAMQPIIPISLKRLAVRHMEDVRSGRIKKEQAQQLLSRQARGVTREDLITDLTRQYDPESAEALAFFRLL